MQSARDRITLGLALILAVGSGLSNSTYVAVPLLLIAIFLLLWGRAPKRTEAVVAGLPFGGKLLWGLAHIDRTITPPVVLPGDAERAAYFARVWTNVTAEEKRRLASVCIHGRGSPFSSPRWERLGSDALVEADTQGHARIRQEYKELIVESLRKEGLLS